MIDFACKQFDLNKIIKCGFGLTKADFQVFVFFVEKNKNSYTTIQIADNLKLNLTTVQKAVKKLHEKNLISRYQKNLKNGGYLYTYRANDRKYITGQIKNFIQRWAKKVETLIDEWEYRSNEKS